ncbi:MAG: PHP domain-containing protein [Terriglobia bacterium]
MRADLHLHSHYSDGSESPAGVVARAHAAGLELIALTDHDTVGGVAEAAAAAGKLGVALIPAAEFTATLGSAGIHILGYFPTMPNEAVRAHLRQVQDFRRKRVETALKRLRRRGLEVDISELPVATCCESLTTAHLAQLLAARGYASSPRAARRKYLGRAQGIVPAFEVTAEEVVRIIQASDGLAVWAHPPRHRLERQLAALVALGLDGIEAYNGRREGETAASVLARKHNLVVTAGSDWHGQGPLGVRVDGLRLDGFFQRIGLPVEAAPGETSSRPTGAERGTATLVQNDE